MIAYFDASALIYLVEGRRPFADRVRSTLKQLARETPRVGAALSRLSWLECRVGPLKADDHETLASFDAFFKRPDLIWIELSRDVIELATSIRALHGLRTADAIQAACCLQLGAEHRMLTGDTTFTRVAGLNVVRVA